MPLYSFKCRKCGHIFDAFCQAAAVNDPRGCKKDGCQGTAFRTYTPATIQQTYKPEEVNPEWIRQNPEVWE